ncbi:MAG: gliding motility-associated C-terminal domain-containing protein [Chitinophagaceae bacterium]|nr:gliding motility-associated C-terminal domain-containing protein [Chitinophagaceae bacterium]
MMARVTCIITGLLVLSVFPGISQDQSCPFNINFSTGDITTWAAKTGLVGGATQQYAAPNTGVSAIPEYSISTTGIQVLTSPGTDRFGGFSTVPTINGYSYGYSIKLGSDATSWELRSNSRNPGGFVRSVTYTVHVPAGSPSVPYTMTYAYALVLENGTHNSNQQPVFTATVRGPAGIISCASPSYYLPTLNDATGGNGQTSTGATLDSAAAIADGFSLSPTLFLSHAGQNNNNGTLLQDVWTKPWTEVTFDLSAYRGQQVTLTFETSNCTPGAHFAYAYIALRNDCGGLRISGFDNACSNTNTVYSIPALANSVYTWTVPAGWDIVSGVNTNIITVKPGSTGGIITVREVNSCADLKDTIAVSTSPPTVAGNVTGDNIVCADANSTVLTLSGETGGILGWLASTDGVTWSDITNTTHQHTARDIAATTRYRALVQNGSGCSIDTSTEAIVTVDPRSNGGSLSPSDFSICATQTQNNSIMLNGSVGQVQNWQYSYDGINWNSFSPVNRSIEYNINSIDRTTYYRALVKSGICPGDTSTAARIQFVNVPFPSATVDPGTASICYGTSIPVNATIIAGTHYSWNNTATLDNAGNGLVSSWPHTIQAMATPQQNTDYVLSVSNAGCPNVLLDTFHVSVTQPITVFAGNDTFIVAGQPLQLNILVSDSLANQYTWSPATGLDYTDITNPVANLSGMAGSTITYSVKAATAEGCFGVDDIKVMVFATAPDIFVPSAFTPNGDGLNDVLRPIGVGISRIDYFRIYNRWGQLVFNASDLEKGWDGRVNGQVQSTATFVYVTQGVDYTGKVITKRGSITLVH